MQILSILGRIYSIEQAPPGLPNDLMHYAMKSLAAALWLMAFAGAERMEAAASFVAEHSLSWAGNIGWLNWRGDIEQGVEIDSFVCIGYLYAANIGWINLGSGAPLNGIRYQNNSAADFGVNV